MRSRHLSGSAYGLNQLPTRVFTLVGQELSSGQGPDRIMLKSPTMQLYAN